MKRYFSMMMPVFQLKFIAWTAGICAAVLYTGHILTTRFEQIRVDTKSEMDTSLKVRTSPEPTIRDPWKLLPDAVIIGAPKCGTTALLLFMELHPDVYQMPAKANIFSNYIQELPDYLPSVIPWNVSDFFKIEKTPSYWRRAVSYSDFDIKNMKDIYTEHGKKVKLILVACDPFTRILSAWTSYDIRPHQSLRYPTFKSFVVNESTNELRAPERPFDVGLYDLIMPLYLKHFRRDQIYVVDGESLKLNPYEEIKHLEQFFGLRDYIKPDMFMFDHTKGFFCPVKNGVVSCLPVNKGRAHAQVPPELAQRVKDYFMPHNKNFSKMIHQSFNWTTYS